MVMFGPGFWTACRDRSGVGAEASGRGRGPFSGRAKIMARGRGARNARRAPCLQPAGRYVEPDSDAMNREARRRADRPCLEGSKSRNRLSELLACRFLFSEPSSAWKGGTHDREVRSPGARWRFGRHHRHCPAVEEAGPESGRASADRERDVARGPDRKSTRLNSSHSQISYAAFCLKTTNNCRGLGCAPVTVNPCIQSLSDT